MTNPNRHFLGSPYTETPTGLCYSCRHLSENDHCYGTGDMPAEGPFLGLACVCPCRDIPVSEQVFTIR